MASHSDQASTVLLRLPLVVAMVAQRYRLSQVPGRRPRSRRPSPCARAPMLMAVDRVG